MIKKTERIFGSFLIVKFEYLGQFDEWGIILELRKGCNTSVKGVLYP